MRRTDDLPPAIWLLALPILYYISATSTPQLHLSISFHLSKVIHTNDYHLANIPYSLTTTFLWENMYLYSPWDKDRSLLETLCICSSANADHHVPLLLVPLPVQTPSQPHLPHQQPKAFCHGREPAWASVVVVADIPPQATGILEIESDSRDFFNEKTSCKFITMR